MYGWMHFVCMYACLDRWIMYGCILYVCVHVCMYVCIHVFMYLLMQYIVNVCRFVSFMCIYIIYYYYSTA